MNAINHINTITIRLMQREDLEQAREIDQLSFNMPWPKSALEYEFENNPRSVLWVAEVTEPNGEKYVVGLIVLWLILEEGHIATLSVHPDYRKQGIASHLLRTALIEAINRKCSEATLEVRETNIPAKKLYNKFGFEIVGRRPHYYKDTNEDALIMTIRKLDQTYLEHLQDYLH